MPITKARSSGNITITPLAERLLAKASAPAVAPTPSFNPKDWVSTREAAKLTGYSQRRIESLCGEGFFIEGKEWKQRPPRPGLRHGGHIRILRSALARLDGG